MDAVPDIADVPTREELLQLHRGMVLIREVEQQLETLFRDGRIPGFIHLSIGQEATAAGVGAALRSDDTVASTHRGHGHALAKGMTPLALVSEILGKEEGICRGRGGSLHVADFSRGMLGANGIVGGGIAIAVGSALAHRKLGTDRVAVVFFGDGAQSEGVLYEALNLAALWSLPLLFVCENNGWSEFSPIENQFRGSLAALAATFGIEYRSADGTDVAEVHAAARALLRRLRAGEGPCILESRTLRIGGHYSGDGQAYRKGRDEPAAGDPLALARARLLGMGAAEAEIAAVEAQVADEVRSAVAQALQGTSPDFAAARSAVYASEIGA